MDSHLEHLQHQEIMNVLVTESEFVLFRQMGAKLIKDGNQWCCLYGENLHDGIVGFGDTPHQAVIDFNKQFNKKR